MQLQVSLKKTFGAVVKSPQMLERFGKAGQGSKADDVSFHLLFWSPQSLFTARLPTWSFDLISYALSEDFLPSISRDHGGGSGILGGIFFRFRKMRVF